MKNDFLNAFNGNYSIDVYLRTNAVGLPINKKIKCNNNILDILDDNLLQNNFIVEKNFGYNTRYWMTQSYSDKTANGKNLIWRYVLNIYMYIIYNHTSSLQVVYIFSIL